MKDTCAKANKIALQTILENPSIDTVVLASLGPFYISGKGYAAEHLGEYAPSRYRLQSKKEGDTFTNKAKVFYEGLDLTISTLRKAGKKVILFQDVPELPFMPSYCFHRPLAPHNSCVISTQSVLKRQEVYKSLLVKLKNRYPDILIFNPIDFMCTKKDCQLTYRNHLIYRDSHHLSSAGSDLIGSKFVDWVKQQPEVG